MNQDVTCTFCFRVSAETPKGKRNRQLLICAGLSKAYEISSETFSMSLTLEDEAGAQQGSTREVESSSSAGELLWGEGLLLPLGLDCPHNKPSETLASECPQKAHQGLSGVGRTRAPVLAPHFKPRMQGPVGVAHGGRTRREVQGSELHS